MDYLLFSREELHGETKFLRGDFVAPIYFGCHGIHGIHGDQSEIGETMLPYKKWNIAAVFGFLIMIWLVERVVYEKVSPFLPTNSLLVPVSTISIVVPL